MNALPEAQTPQWPAIRMSGRNDSSSTTRSSTSITGRSAVHNNHGRTRQPDSATARPRQKCQALTGTTVAKEPELRPETVEQLPEPKVKHEPELHTQSSLYSSRTGSPKPFLGHEARHRQTFRSAGGVSLQVSSTGRAVGSRPVKHRLVEIIFLASGSSATAFLIASSSIARPYSAHSSRRLLAPLARCSQSGRLCSCAR